MPFAIRTALCTKERQLAVDRDLALATCARVLIAALSPSPAADAPPRSFYRWISTELDAFKAADFTMPLRPPNPLLPRRVLGLPAREIALTQR